MTVIEILRDKRVLQQNRTSNDEYCKHLYIEGL